MIRTGKHAPVSGAHSENRSAMPADVGIGAYVVIFVPDNQQGLINQIKRKIITRGANLRDMAGTYPLPVKQVLDFLFVVFFLMMIS